MATKLETRTFHDIFVIGLIGVVMAVNAILRQIRGDLCYRCGPGYGLLIALCIFALIYGLFLRHRIPIVGQKKRD